MPRTAKSVNGKTATRGRGRPRTNTSLSSTALASLRSKQIDADDEESELVTGTKGGKKQQKLVMEIQPIKTRRIVAFLVGTSPLIMHRFALKAWQELLYPSPKKNSAERAASLKHDPLAEYQGCFYKNRDTHSDTLFHIPNGMPHQALAAAALDIPGTTRAAMERLTSVVNPTINLWGLPQMFMAMVRNSDQNRTPDVRTRPIFPRWACQIEIDYKVDPLTDAQILNLLGAAGVIVGMGDWRPQRGGSYGKFRICSPTDAEYKAIIKEGARAGQQRAFEKPLYFDEETQELMTWFLQELSRRRQNDDEGEMVQPESTGRANGRGRGRRGAVAEEESAVEA
jgi:hypothetical protein